MFNNLYKRKHFPKVTVDSLPEGLKAELEGYDAVFIESNVLPELYIEFPEDSAPKELHLNRLVNKYGWNVAQYERDDVIDGVVPATITPMDPGERNRKGYDDVSTEFDDEVRRSRRGTEQEILYRKSDAPIDVLDDEEFEDDVEEEPLEVLGKPEEEEDFVYEKHGCSRERKLRDKYRGDRRRGLRESDRKMGNSWRTEKVKINVAIETHGDDINSALLKLSDKLVNLGGRVVPGMHDDIVKRWNARVEDGRDGKFVAYVDLEEGRDGNYRKIYRSTQITVSDI